MVYEPGSPSYKEYSIPLEEVRRDAGGGIPNSIESRAFGIGLSRRGGGGPGSRSGGAASGGSGRSADGDRGPARRGDTGRSGDTTEPGDLRRRIADAEAAGAPFLWELAPLLLVLLPALLVGLLLARRGTEQRPAT